MTAATERQNGNGGTDTERIRKYGNYSQSQAVAVLEMDSFVSVVSSAALMQKYEIGLYLLTAARALIVVL